MRERLRGERVVRQSQHCKASTFLVRSRLPRRIAPDYAAASCTPRPRDAYCSRNPPPPHHPYHAMRLRSRRERLHPPRPRTACLLPLAGTAAAIEEAARRVRCCPFPTLVPRDRPPSLLARERPALACSPIAARLQSERRGRERACRRPLFAQLLSFLCFLCSRRG